MDQFAIDGMAWWNALDEKTRRYWMDMANSASPADAYRAYLAYQREVRGQG